MSTSKSLQALLYQCTVLICGRNHFCWAAFQLSRAVQSSGTAWSSLLALWILPLFLAFRSRQVRVTLCVSSISPPGLTMAFPTPLTCSSTSGTLFVTTWSRVPLSHRFWCTAGMQMAVHVWQISNVIIIWTLLKKKKTLRGTAIGIYKFKKGLDKGPIKK